MDFQQLYKKIDEMSGRIGFYYKNMVTGETAGYNSTEVFSPASTIKLPIMMAVFKLAASGEGSLEDKIRVKQEDKVPSCGALNSFTGEPVVDVRTLCNLMITISDNTAMNVLVGHYGVKRLNEVFRSMGLSVTTVNRKLYDMEANKRELKNIIKIDEIAMLFERLYNYEFVSETVSMDILDILCRQQIEHKLCGMLPPETKVAHKTGEDDHISHDMGIVYCNQPFIVCFASNGVLPYEFNSFISTTTVSIFDYCNKKER